MKRLALISRSSPFTLQGALMWQTHIIPPVYPANCVNKECGWRVTVKCLEIWNTCSYNYFINFLLVLSCCDDWVCSQKPSFGCFRLALLCSLALCVPVSREKKRAVVLNNQHRPKGMCDFLVWWLTLFVATWWKSFHVSEHRIQSIFPLNPKAVKGTKHHRNLPAQIM